ncbi:hypothetical protein SAMN05216285_2986 [Natrinema salifodinae]|uniref:PGF-CTERM protein n=2 Tax=Natrinema salifodinae TaxID=1202768 RepID=A0A1I0Q2J1_9EURY|nr:hypothetical protein SAMN05216285_2986 [Natrinema salifodinae]
MLLAAVLLTGGVVGPVAAGSAAGPTGPSPSASSLSAVSHAASTDAPASSPGVVQNETDRPEDPSTEDTVGYVEGYWYDDELPVDDRDDAAVDDDELDPVVYRSMARVERIRNMTFADEVDVEVVSRAEYRQNSGDRFANVSEDERLEHNVAYEALFMVDRETAATDATESVYGGAVDGYYDPETDEIVIVSENPDTPELNELTLGHELVHALQDQRFDLSQFEGETNDEEVAMNGLIEGDAAWVERAYESRCGVEWDCLSTSTERSGQLDVNWGIYFSVYQPYSDGPDYVSSLRQQGDGWDAVNAAYDDPPTSTSAVIHPGSEREPADVSVPDRSDDAWRQLEVDGEVANDTVGEAGMVAMFAADALDGQQSVIASGELFTGGEGYEYDHSYTNGWAGDELVVYATDEAASADDPTAAAGDAGYVWRTQWQSAADARQFRDGYLELLDHHGAEAVDGHRDTYVIDDGGYAGVYYFEHDGETLTLVRAPSVDDLSAVEAGAAPEGEDTVELGESDKTETVPGFGAPAAAAAIAVLGAGARLAVGRGRIGSRTQSNRTDDSTRD